MQLPKIKVHDHQYSTTQGKWLIIAVTSQYIKFKKKYKRAPKKLLLGKNQVEIMELDEVAKSTISGGEIVHTENQSEVKFK